LEAVEKKGTKQKRENYRIKGELRFISLGERSQKIDSRGGETRSN